VAGALDADVGDRGRHPRNGTTDGMGIGVQEAGIRGFPVARRKVERHVGEMAPCGARFKAAAARRPGLPCYAHHVGAP